MQELDAESIATLVKGGVATLSLALGSKPAALLIEKISGAIGWYVEPQKILRNARAEAAASIIKAEAEQEIKSVEQRAASRMIYEETKFQQNIENVILKTLSSVKDDARPNEIDDDWMTNFFDKCRKVSDKEMQNLWAQVLAGEANNPGAFSPKTIHEMSVLTKRDAFLFQKYSKFIWYYGDSKPMIIYPVGMAKSDYLGELRAFDMFTLCDMGLLTYQESVPFSFTTSGLVLSYGDKRFAVYQKAVNGKSPGVVRFPFGLVQMTQTGNELSRLLSPEVDFNYMQEVINTWQQNGFLLEEIDNPL